MEDSSSELIPRDISTDIFFHIATKLTDKELLLLFPFFGEKITSLFQNNEFWYRRSEYLARKDLLERQGVQWSKIYYTLLYTLEDNYDEDSSPTWTHLDYIPSLYVLEEVFGPPDWADSQEEVWLEVLTPEVLTYLLKLGYLEDRLEYELEPLKHHASDGRLEMVIHLLDMIRKRVALNDPSEAYLIGDIVEENIGEAMSDSASMGRLEIFKYLIEGWTYQYIQPDRLMHSALDGRNKDIIRYVTDLYGSDILLQATLKDDSIPGLEVLLEHEYDRDFWRSVFRDALSKGAGNIVRYLIEHEIISDKNLNWEDILRNAMLSYHNSLVRYASTRVEKIPDNILKSSIDSPYIFNIILKHPNLYVNRKVSDIIDLIDRIETKYMKDENARILIEDPRFKVEDLSYEQFETLLKIINYSSNKRKLDKQFVTEHYARVRSTGSTRELIQVMRSELRKNTIYALILRYILLKNPNSRELIDWMIEQKNEVIIEAGRCIMEKDLPSSEEVIPIRALLLYLLHPRMSVQEHISALEEEGFSRDDIARSNRLIGTFLRMKKRMNSRSRTEEN